MSERNVSSASHLWLALVVFWGACTAQTSGPPSIALETRGDGTSVIVVKNIDAAARDAVRAAGDTHDQLEKTLRVSVGEGQPAMRGRYTIDSNALVFTPLFPFDAGRQYHVTYAPANLSATVALPALKIEPSTVVSQIYPSGDVVPENQLRLYIHFSAPMGLKGGLDYVQLVDADGKVVVDPFLPLDAEFWNDDRTRYTVFFDPGRQKRGITPNQQMGRSLELGKRYTLVVDREWRDENGLPLKETYRRAFTVGPADERPLDTKAWKIAPPKAETRDALVVTFPEALDRGLLLRALGVEANGQMLGGEVRVEAGETRWSFTPPDTWRAGTYQVIALGMLEDLAGNRIGRAFEVDQFDRTDRSPEPQRIAIPFTVR